MSDPFRRDELPSAISEINVVPLADVSLVLLIILLLLSPMMAQSMLHIKTAGKAVDKDPLPYDVPDDKPPELVLVVDMGPGGVAIGETLFSSTAELAAYLRLELLRRSDRKVFLAPHADVLHGSVVDMLEAIKASGASSVALVKTVEAPAP